MQSRGAVAGEFIVKRRRNHFRRGYPFIPLNLFLPILAAIQAPAIMMSQNRQDEKDRLRSELDFQVNRRAEAGIQSLSRQMSMRMEKMEDLAQQTANPEARTEFRGGERSRAVMDKGPKRATDRWQASGACQSA